MKQEPDLQQKPDSIQKKFQRYFVGLIVFIIAVIVVILLTGRGTLAL